MKTVFMTTQHSQAWEYVWYLTLFFACQQGHAFSPQGHFRQVDRSSGILLRCRFQGYPPLRKICEERLRSGARPEANIPG